MEERQEVVKKIAIMLKKVADAKLHQEVEEAVNEFIGWWKREVERCRE